MRFRSFPVAELPVGMKLGCSVYDDQRVKLLSAGVHITQPLIEGLHRRRILSVLVSAGDIGRMLAFRPQGSAKYAFPDRTGSGCSLTSGPTQMLDACLPDMLQSGAVTRGPQFREQFHRPGATTYNKGLMADLADGHERQIARLDEHCRNIAKGGLEELAGIVPAADELLKSSIDDIDLFVNLGGSPSGGNYPGRHSRHTAMVAAAIGAELGLDADQLRQLAVGCLIHDLGMLRVDPAMLKAQRFLAQEEFVEIAKHPIRTFEVLSENLDLIPPGARMVAYQMHERFDGTGYPRGRSGQQIHVLARIAAVADTYVALVAPRPHRSGMLPYSAAAKIIKDTAAGKFDPAVVRGFLRAASLFPIGSLVELNDHRVGRIIRSNPNTYDRPILEVWFKGRTEGTPGILDLSQENSVKVIRPLATLA